MGREGYQEATHLAPAGWEGWGTGRGREATHLVPERWEVWCTGRGQEAGA